MTATKQEAARDAKGRLLCAECDGEGRYEVQLPARSSTQLDPDHVEVRCEACDGDGLRRCPVCGEAATIVGEGGVNAFCGVEHAFEENDWPECERSCGRPQSLAESPWCSERCRERFEQRVALSAAPMREASHG